MCLQLKSTYCPHSFDDIHYWYVDIDGRENLKQLVEDLDVKETYISADFTADYSDGGKNHNPCCTYSYALHNPTDPVNPDLTCDFPQNQVDAIDPNDPDITYMEDETQDLITAETIETCHIVTEDSNEPYPIEPGRYEVVHTDNPRMTRIIVLKTH